MTIITENKYDKSLQPVCDSCQKQKPALVQIYVRGSDEYEQFICKECLTEALSELIGNDFIFSKSASNKLDNLTNLPRGEITDL